jgi:hypothetical protein
VGQQAVAEHHLERAVRPRPAQQVARREAGEAAVDPGPDARGAALAAAVDGDGVAGVAQGADELRVAAADVEDPRAAPGREQPERRARLPLEEPLADPPREAAGVGVRRGLDVGVFARGRRVDDARQA